MARAKQPSKRKRRGKALAALGATGLSFSLASSASGAPAVNMPRPNTGASQEITLAEEELSDVNLGTFYVFDKENAPAGLQLVRGGGCGGCRGGGGGCGCGGGFRGCGGGFRGCGGGCGCGGCVGYGCVGYLWYGYGCYGYSYGCYGYGCTGCGGCRY
jgi:hypothetical protein